MKKLPVAEERGRKAAAAAAAFLAYIQEAIGFDHPPGDDALSNSHAYELPGHPGREGGQIQFMMKQGWEHPVQVRDQYLQERPDWNIIACDKCGFDELFDPPSDLIARIFPNVPSDSKMESFTSFCPLCGGVQVVGNKDTNLER